jgi:para-nitrobenzyl esterase
MPILQGNVEEEMSELGFDASKDIHTPQDYTRAVLALTGGGTAASDLLRLYPVGNYDTPAKAFNAISADSKYVCPSRRVLRAISASQGEFVGRFFYTHVYSSGTFVKFGASHGYELPFIFDTLSGMDVSPTTDELTLVNTFQDTWSTFARTGTSPQLRRYDANKDNYVEFNTPLSEHEHLRSQQCDFWDLSAN